LPLLALWKSALERSHSFSFFPGIAFGAFRKKRPLSLSIRTKFESDAATAMPPPHVPNIALI
jgi:hypothetical protein